MLHFPIPGPVMLKERGVFKLKFCFSNSPIGFGKALYKYKFGCNVAFKSMTTIVNFFVQFGSKQRLPLSFGELDVIFSTPGV